MPGSTFQFEGFDILSLWRLIQSGSMKAEVPMIGSFALNRNEFILDIEDPKVWYDLFNIMIPAIQKQVIKVNAAPKVRRQRFFPFQILETYKAKFIETVRTMPTADLLISFVEIIRGTAELLNREQKTIILHYFGAMIFKMGYRARGFVPTLVGVKYIEVVDYIKMLEFLNDLALQTDFFSTPSLYPKKEPERLSYYG